MVVVFILSDGVTALFLLQLFLLFTSTFTLTFFGVWSMSCPLLFAVQSNIRSSLEAPGGETSASKDYCGLTLSVILRLAGSVAIL